MAVVRRKVLGAIGAGLALTVSGYAKATAILPDAGLLRLCASFQDLHARSYAAPDDTNEWERLASQRWEVSDAIEGMTPTTDAGRLAKAKVALVLMEECACTNSSYERFTLATLRNLVGSAAA